MRKTDTKWIELGNETPADRVSLELDFAPTKRQMAFIFAVLAMFDKATSIYIWTFTFKDVYSDFIAAARCRHLLDRLRKRFGFFSFVRVFEQHPGQHGLHCHVLLTRRLPAAQIWRIAAKCGLGRVDVKKIKKEDSRETAFYMAKYLGKRGVEMEKGVRKFGTGGMLSSSRNIECKSKASDALRKTWSLLKSSGRKPSMQQIRYCKLVGQCPVTTL